MQSVIKYDSHRRRTTVDRSICTELHIQIRFFSRSKKLNEASIASKKQIKYYFVFFTRYIIICDYKSCWCYFVISSRTFLFGLQLLLSLCSNDANTPLKYSPLWYGMNHSDKKLDFRFWFTPKSRRRRYTVLSRWLLWTCLRSIL